MANNLKVHGTHGYQPYREVEPVASYPRIDPQQPRDQYPQRQPAARQNIDDQARRRFRAMRGLIDLLKESHRIVRVDYFTVETELRELGREIAEQELIQQLLDLQIPVDDLEPLFMSMKQQFEVPHLEVAGALREESGLVPYFVPGLQKALLCFDQLPLPAFQGRSDITHQLNQEGLFDTEKGRVRLNLRKVPGDNPTGLVLHIRLLVAVGEVDEEGRRVFLYRRPGSDYGLYADKQINLSI